MTPGITARGLGRLLLACAALATFSAPGPAPAQEAPNPPEAAVLADWSAHAALARANRTCPVRQDYDFTDPDFRDMTVNAALQTLAMKDRAPPIALNYALQYLVDASLPLKNGGSTAVSLRKLDLSGLDLFDLQLAYGFFSKARFVGADMPYVNFCSANLQNADLTGAQMVLGDFTHAYLLRTTFKGAYLFKAKFDKARLRETDFTDANLREASFGTADLGRVILTGADISAADFSASTGLTQAQVNAACYRPSLGQPVLPPGLNMPPTCP